MKLMRQDRTLSPVGALIRAYRAERGMSQLDLALEADISSRHLSFIETGRSAPSRETVLSLAAALNVPLRDRNGLLEAAGYARLYGETPLGADSMTHVKEALSLILKSSGENPAWVINLRFDALMSNHAGRSLLKAFCACPPDEIPNFARLLISDNGLKPFIENADEVAVHVIERIRRDIGGMHTRTPEDEALLQEILPASVALRAKRTTLAPDFLLVPIRFRRGALSLDLFTTVTTFGSPNDVTLQELRVETLFPADARSKQKLARIVRS
jgi:transcriptional regulator with XRE-family HTH domain